MPEVSSRPAPQGGGRSGLFWGRRCFDPLDRRRLFQIELGRRHHLDERVRDPLDLLELLFYLVETPAEGG
jgi:hypothetical protein